jgi:hypothetical protein
MQDPLAPQPQVQIQQRPLAAPGTDSHYLHWRPIIGGALAASAVIVVLTGFGSALGFGNLSSTWRDPSAVLALLSGVWFLVVSAGSLALGGYIAGRARSSWENTNAEERQFRDGIHGLLVWALAVIIGSVLIALAPNPFPDDARTSAESTPVSSQSLGAPSSLLSISLDRMLRSDRRPGQAEPALRNEAGRLLAEAVSARNFPAEDRQQLTRDVAAATGLPPADAQKRTNDSIAEATNRIKASRHSSVIVAFLTAASLALAASVAWFAAEAGGRHRDTGVFPSVAWSHRRVRLVMKE